MKHRFNTFDIVCGVAELQRLVGFRCNQIYDVDNKILLIRLQGGENKTILLLESGIRFHTTSFDWPKNNAPSGFSMKLRKHLKNKRLEKLQQLGIDRIIDLQFGCGDASYHLFLELYDRGNMILTDNELNILYILRPHSDGEEIRFAVREKYPIDRAKQSSFLPTLEDLRQEILKAPKNILLRKFLMSFVDGGPALIEHVLIENKLENCMINYDIDEKIKSQKTKLKIDQIKFRPFDVENELDALLNAITNGRSILENSEIPVKGYIVQKREENPNLEESDKKIFLQNIEFHPYLLNQFKNQFVAVFDTFMQAVDEFYSTLEGQKIDMKTLQQEREAYKKLHNVEKDHAKRLEELARIQEIDKQKAELITRNKELVDNAILAVQSALANQMSWSDIYELVKAAQSNGDVVANSIKQLKLEINNISLELSDPYSNTSTEDNSNKNLPILFPTQIIDVDLSLSAWRNARRYYDLKRSAAQKEQKTIDASQKALKSAQRKTQQTLKEVRTISTISKARKVYWFEKFYWFISSENFLVIGGRDAQQNEIIVKRYMRSSDIYVHAEIQGASSVVIRNPLGIEIPPKTLLEAGTMAICYSVAWDAKVVTNAYWVKSDQVSKTAPSGEYLATGSFMIRGKKNFLPPCHLIMGLSLLFKIEESFVEAHRGERKIRKLEDECGEPLCENSSSSKYGLEKELNQIASILSEIDVKTENKDGNFPDSQVKIEHDTGRVTIESQSEVLNSIIADKPKEQVSEETIIISALPPRKKQQSSRKRKEAERKCKFSNIEEISLEDDSKISSQMKRGQKGKLKKIKSKYKNQDEEERNLRMQILRSSGGGKTQLVTKEEQNKNENPISVLNFKKDMPNKNDNTLDNDENDDLLISNDIEMIDSLTGQPFENDELLFAIPIVAPYQSLQNYKFKIKLTPGTGKRGRAAKTSLAMFSKEKSCSTRVKDLIKSIKDETLARNIPGKVKISAPQLQKYQK